MNPVLEKLNAVLRDCAPAAVAVSGGVDSMTLAFAAGKCLGNRVEMFHAVSPAVPSAATARVARYAQVQSWDLKTINAHEFDDEQYVANPANRCFFCKQNLYGTIVAATPNQVMSGTNLDDLGDWRPGLKAAANHGVRHPFVEAGIDKDAVRELARAFGLSDVAELPAAPCLSSRVETGIPIDARELTFIDATETLIRASVASSSVRCRIRRSGIVIELDATTHAGLPRALQDSLAADIDALARHHEVAGDISFAPYERGSAFLRDSR
jgi:uncharacterized protein